MAGRVSTRLLLALVVVAAAAASVALGAHSSGAAGGTTVLVSRAGGRNGAGGDGNSVTPSVSASGRFVAFASRAKDLARGDSDAQRDVFVRDMKAGTTVLVSRASGPNGAAANGISIDASISGSGRYVAFASNATNLVADPTGGSLHIFVRDLVANTTELVSRATGPG